jgi:transposase
MQDRDGAKPVLLQAYLVSPIRCVFADAAFAGRLLDWAAHILRTTIHVVRKPAGQRGFAVIPRRWAVERTLAWLTAHRRLARDYERDPAVSERSAGRRSTPSPGASPAADPPPGNSAARFQL